MADPVTERRWSRRSPPSRSRSSRSRSSRSRGQEPAGWAAAPVVADTVAEAETAADEAPAERPLPRRASPTPAPMPRRREPAPRARRRRARHRRRRGPAPPSPPPAPAAPAMPAGLVPRSVGPLRAALLGRRRRGPSTWHARARCSPTRPSPDPDARRPRACGSSGADARHLARPRRHPDRDASTARSCATRGSCRRSSARGSSSRATTGSPPTCWPRIEHPDFLYVSHLHSDHLDEAFLADHVDRSTTVLLPDFPTRELERRLRGLGFTRFVRTEHATPIEVADGLTIEIHVETSITDGPGGDSALIVDDGESRLLNQNDCRLHDLAALTAHGPIDQQWLQYSGAIWYPMVYDMPDERMRGAGRAKVERQFARALRYVQAVGARVVVPSAGPPCFLDPELFGLNVITGDELSIFPDATRVPRPARRGGHRHGPPRDPWHGGRRPTPAGRRRPPAARRRGRADLHRQEGLPATTTPPTGSRGWPTQRAALARSRPPTCWPPCRRGGSRCWRWPRRCGRPSAPPPPPRARRRSTSSSTSRPARCGLGRRALRVLVRRRPRASSRPSSPRGPSTGRTRCSCRAASGRGAPGEFNEFLYNFFKSLSPERMARAEAEAPPRDSSAARSTPTARWRRCGWATWIVERYCPHRRADLAIVRPRRRLRAHLRAPRLAVRPRDRALPHRRRPLDQGPSRPDEPAG